MFNIIMKAVEKYEPIYHHLRKLIRCYILEMLKMHVEIASMLKKKPILKPFDQPVDIENLKVGSIAKEK